MSPIPSPARAARRAGVLEHRIVEGAVAPYPLFQYLPAVLLTQLGMGDIGVYEAFSVISVVSFCATIAIGRLAGFAHRAAVGGASGCPCAHHGAAGV